MMEVPDNISFEELNLKGRIIFLDVDGTLLPDGELHFDPAVIQCLEKLKNNNKVFLCTNSNDRIRNKKIEELLGLPIVTYDHKKPSFGIIKKIGVKKGDENLLVIGDKFLIDGIFALNIKARFIRINRKISGKEPVIIKLINFLDDKLWQLMKSAKII